MRTEISPRLGRIALFVGLAVQLVVLSMQLLNWAFPRRNYSFVGHDVPRELPVRLNFVNAKILDDETHFQLEGGHSDAEWNSLRPPGKGLVYLGDAYYAYDVAVWHQVHCLNHLRAMLVAGDDGSDHTQHCFQYLMKALLCHADTTLEPGGGKQRRADGSAGAPRFNVTHTCRDWQQLYRWHADHVAQWTPEQHDRLNNAVSEDDESTLFRVKPADQPDQHVSHADGLP